MKVRIDKKGKPRPTISKEEALFLIEYAKLNAKDAIYHVSAEAAFPHQPYLQLIGATSALVPGNGVREKMTSTSFRVLRSQYQRFKEVVRSEGLTTCQDLRLYLEWRISMADHREARRTPKYVS